MDNDFDLKRIDDYAKTFTGNHQIRKPWWKRIQEIKMWFKYVVIIVFVIDAITELMASRNKKFNVPTPRTRLMTGILYVVLAVLAMIVQACESL